MKVNVSEMSLMVDEILVLSNRLREIETSANLHFRRLAMTIVMEEEKEKKCTATIVSLNFSNSTVSNATAKSRCPKEGTTVANARR